MSRETHSITRKPTESGLVGTSVSLDEEVPRQLKTERNVATLRLLWAERQFLFKGLVFGLVLSLVVAFLVPSQYESSAKLMPPDQSGLGLGGGLGLGMLAALGGKEGGGSAGFGGEIGDLLGVKTTGELFVGVLESRTIQDDLINKFNLRKVYWDRDWVDARKDLTRKTDISIDRKSGILTLTVTDRSPQRAAAMAKEYIDQLNSVLAQEDTSQAHRERVFLEGRLGQVKSDLEAAEQNFGQFASKNVALDIPTQGKVMVEATASLEGDLVAAETELEGLRQIYSDGNVRVRSTQARINELQSQLEKLGGTTTGAATNEASGAESIYPSIRRLPLLGVTYADLLRRTKVQEAIFQTLTQEYEVAKVQEAKELPSVKVLDVPDIPERKSFPPRVVIVLLGGLFDLLVCVAWVLGRERWDAAPAAPGKMLAEEVYLEIRNGVARIPRLGSKRELRNGE